MRRDTYRASYGSIADFRDSEVEGSRTKRDVAGWQISATAETWCQSEAQTCILKQPLPSKPPTPSESVVAFNTLVRFWIASGDQERIQAVERGYARLSAVGRGELDPDAEVTELRSLPLGRGHTGGIRASASCHRALRAA
jgi:hypothetical protein